LWYKYQGQAIVIHSFLAAPYDIMENLIILVYSLILAVCAAAIHRPISKMMEQFYLPASIPISSTAISLALTIGTGIFVIQLFSIY